MNYTISCFTISKNMKKKEILGRIRDLGGQLKKFYKDREGSCLPEGLLVFGLLGLGLSSYMTLDETLIKGNRNWVYGHLPELMTVFLPSTFISVLGLAGLSISKNNQ